MTGLLETEIAPSIKPTSKNKGQNFDKSIRLMAGTYGIANILWGTMANLLVINMADS